MYPTVFSFNIPLSSELNYSLIFTQLHLSGEPLPPAARQPKSVKVKFILGAENHLKDIRMSGKYPIDVKNRKFLLFHLWKHQNTWVLLYRFHVTVHYRVINTNLLDSCTKLKTHKNPIWSMLNPWKVQKGPKKGSKE